MPRYAATLYAVDFSPLPAAAMCCFTRAIDDADAAAAVTALYV